MYFSSPVSEMEILSSLPTYQPGMKTIKYKMSMCCGPWIFLSVFKGTIVLSEESKNKI